MTIFRGVAVLSLLLLLIACSGDDPSSDPSEPTSQPTTTSTTPSPTGPVEPEPPELAPRPTKASAAAFVKYFWEVADYAQKAAEIDTLRSLGAETCAYCRGGVRYIRELLAKGGVVKRKPYTVTITRARLGKVGGTIDIATVTFRLAIPKSVEFYGLGDARNRRFPGGRRTYEFLLEWRPSMMTWRVQRVVQA